MKTSRSGTLTRNKERGKPMNLKRYIPLIVLVLLVAAATVQGLRQQTTEPKLFQSQVSGTENSIEQISSFELEIELREGKEIEMEYSNRRQNTEENQETQKIRNLVEALPPLTESRPLATIQATLDHLGIDEENVKEFELEYELNDGIDRKIELEVDHDDDDDDD